MRLDGCPYRRFSHGCCRQPNLHSAFLEMKRPLEPFPIRVIISTAEGTGGACRVFCSVAPSYPFTSLISTSSEGPNIPFHPILKNSSFWLCTIKKVTNMKELRARRTPDASPLLQPA